MLSLLGRSFDGMYISLAQQIGGIDPLLDSFFGFLRRKSDFFSGAASSNAARETILNAFTKNKDRYEEDVHEKIDKEKKRKAEEDARLKRVEMDKAKQHKHGDAKRYEELNEGEATKINAEGAHAKQQPSMLASTSDAADASFVEGGGEDDGKSKGKETRPVNNGGVCDNYCWTQTLGDVQVWSAMRRILDPSPSPSNALRRTPAAPSSASLCA